MIRKTLKISKFDIVCFLIYLVYIKPGVVEDISVLDVCWNMARFGLTCVFGMYFLINRRIPKNIIYPILILGVTFLTTISKNGLLSLVWGHWVPVIGILAWVEINRDRLKEMLHVFFEGGRILIFVNLIIMLMYPEGLWKRELHLTIWLLGQKQDFITCILSTIFFGIILCAISPRYKNKFVRTIIYVAGTIMVRRIQTKF